MYIVLITMRRDWTGQREDSEFQQDSSHISRFYISSAQDRVLLVYCAWRSLKLYGSIQTPVLAHDVKRSLFRYPKIIT